MAVSSLAITAPARLPRSFARARHPLPNPPLKGEGISSPGPFARGGKLPRRKGIGLAERFKDLTNWLAEGEAEASQGYFTAASMGQHQPSRTWFGQVMPGSWAPNVDGDGIDGKVAGVAAIRGHDPAFDENVFLAQVQRLFFAVLEAWTSLKPELSQGVMASLIWEQQKAQINGYRQDGWRNLLDQLTFVSAIVAGALSDAGFDTVTVRINASSADYDVDAGGRVLRGDRTPWEWTEDWIFQRPSTLTSSQPGTITAMACPSCGASVNVDITSICPYCDAAVISGKFGWLLTRIDRI